MRYDSKKWASGEKPVELGTNDKVKFEKLTASIHDIKFCVVKFLGSFFHESLIPRCFFVIVNAYI